MNPSLVSNLVLLMLAGVAATTYVRTGKVHNWTTLPAIFVGVAVAAWSGDVKSSLWGLGIGFGLLVIFYRYHILGGGALKEIAAIGAIKGSAFVVKVIGLNLVMVLLWLAGTAIMNRTRPAPDEDDRNARPVIPYPVMTCVAVLGVLTLDWFGLPR